MDTGVATSEDDLSLDEAVQVAIGLIAEDEEGAALQVLTRTLAVAPDFFPALNVLGVLICQLAGPEKAEPIMRRATELAPRDPGIWNNLGNILVEKKDIEGAAASYRRALALDPRAVDPLSNLASLLTSRRHFTEAEDLLRQAIAINPEFGNAHFVLASLLIKLGRNREASDHMDAATAFGAADSVSPGIMSGALWKVGRRDEAIAAVKAWIARAPNDPEARHKLASLTGNDAPDRAPDDYIEKVFDSFSRTFDAKLDQLGYVAPALTGAAVARALGEPRADRMVLDAGCGTGKCAPFLKPYASRLEGVDLSGGMLAKAEGLDVYDDLEKAELTAFLAERRAMFDLIVSADTICYFGRIEGFCTAASGALKPDGLLVFTVEWLAEDNPEGYAITSSGRYAHNEAYVLKCLAEAGFARVEVEHDKLRMESAAPVAGLVVTARRAG